MKSLIEYNYDKENKCYDTVVNTFKIQDIVLRVLQLGDEFTIRDVQQIWQKQWSRGILRDYWCPEFSHIRQALDEIVGTKLTKTYISTKLEKGSVTEPKYKLL